LCFLSVHILDMIHGVLKCEKRLKQIHVKALDLSSKWKVQSESLFKT